MIFNKVLFGNVTLMKLMFMLGLIFFWLIIAKILSLYLRKTLKNKLNKDHLEIIIKLIYYAIVIITLIWSLSIFGIKLSGLLVAGGIAGIVIGFASQSIIGNLISGVFLMIERPMKIGNAVEIDGTVGVVEDIKIISTTIRTWDGFHIRMPNEKIFTTNITNYVSNVVRRFGYTVGIRYEDDADKAIYIINQIIEEEPFALKNPSPLVFVDNLGDSSVNITVKIWAPVSEWWGLKQKMLWIIKTTLQENNIEIAFPQSVLWIGDNNIKDKLLKK
ncbi:MAG: mechanosensitive ion channel family protein [Candidatus Cloacimonetes bacterium]|jgi:small-conductance mechanosensitive channel|nr:mechanosensitive ion channel family protein [Candidatus Cloacimonadota bacterium]